MPEVLLKGKDKLNFLRALIGVCSAGFSYSNDASFLLSYSADALHISLILQHCMFPFIPLHYLHTVLLCSF